MKKLLIALFAALAIAVPASAFAEATADKPAGIFEDFMANKLVFTEFGLSYGNAIDPDGISNNTDGVFDTAVFDAKAGVEILKWGNLYAGCGFHYYQNRADWQQHYTFYPLYGGVRVNIMPEWFIYPSLFAEYGVAFANHHFINAYVMDDQPWTASYYSFGLGIDWKVADIAVLRMTFERPSFSNNDGAEIHVFKTGLSWKILY